MAVPLINAADHLMHCESRKICLIRFTSLRDKSKYDFLPTLSKGRLRCWVTSLASSWTIKTDKWESRKVICKWWWMCYKELEGCVWRHSLTHPTENLLFGKIKWMLKCTFTVWCKTTTYDVKWNAQNRNKERKKKPYTQVSCRCSNALFSYVAHSCRSTESKCWTERLKITFCTFLSRSKEGNKNARNRFLIALARTIKRNSAAMMIRLFTRLKCWSRKWEFRRWSSSGSSDVIRLFSAGNYVLITHRCRGSPSALLYVKRGEA